MSIIKKRTLQTVGNPRLPDQTRRSFMWKTGAAFSAAFASAAACESKTTVEKAANGANLAEQREGLSGQLGIFEDMRAIRKLHNAYGSFLSQGAYDEIVDLFADDGEAHFNGGIFVGKDKGVHRLYIDNFRRDFAGNGKTQTPIHGFLLDHMQQHDSIDVAPDRRFARARFHCLMLSSVPVESSSSLMTMARLQGQGIAQWWEGGIFINFYEKKDDIWWIKKLKYRTIWQADYALGRSYAKPVFVWSFVKTYPEDPTGPDRLMRPWPESQSDAALMHFRHPHPVTVELWRA
jgi:hypothetical protein